MLEREECCSIDFISKVVNSAIIHGYTLEVDYFFFFFFNLRQFWSQNSLTVKGLFTL